MKRFIFLLLCGLIVALAVQSRDVGPEPDVGVEVNYSITSMPVAVLPAALPWQFEAVDAVCVDSRSQVTSAPEVFIKPYCNPDYGLSMFNFGNIINSHNRADNIKNPYCDLPLPRARHV